MDLSRRQHAPNKQCALNNDVRLITLTHQNNSIVQYLWLVVVGSLVV